MKGYQFIAQYLKKSGVSHIFYVESMLENMLLEASKLGIQPVMAHTENAAGYMADGYARSSAKVGVCMAQSIGTANLAGGIYDASLAHSPVLAITGKKPPFLQYTGAYQEGEHRLIFEGITKFNGDVTQPAQLSHVLKLALRKAISGRPGPVHIDVPNNLGVDIEFSEIHEKEMASGGVIQYPEIRQTADLVSLQEAAVWIKESNRPLIVAGRGALNSGAGEALLLIAGKADIPIATTPDGKTVIDEASDYWAGIIGAYGNRCANRLAKVSDLVIFVGTEANDQTTCNWTMPSKDTKVIHIEIDSSEIGKNYRNTIGLCGDAKMVLEQLGEVVEIQERMEWRKEVRSCISSEAAELQVLIQSDTWPISPYKLCHELSSFMPADAILVADTGNSAIWTCTQVRMKDTQRYYRAAGSLGWSYPASLGVKCANPDKPVFCFLGDGAFYYHLSEMETSVRNGINTITVINNNGGLVQVRELLDIVYGDDDQSMKEKAYRFGAINFSRIAEEMGCFALRVEKSEDLIPALKQAMESNRPAVVEVMTSDVYTPNPMPEGPRPLYGAASARP